MNRFPNVGVCFGLLILLGTSEYAVSFELVYALLNEDVVLNPQFTGELQEVLWKYETDKIAEYTSSPKSLEYFSSFKGRTELNTADGSLTIKRVTFEDRGIYYAELQVDGRTQTHKFNIEVIRHVSKPTVTCNVNESIAMLHCMGDKNTETSFKWEGPEGQIHTGNKLMTSLKENDDSKYVCVASNKISEQRSDPFAVTDCKKADAGDFPVWATALIVVILGALLCSILYFVCKKVRGTQSMAGHYATCLTVIKQEEELDNVTSNESEQGEQGNVRINETAPLMETNPNKSDSENEPGPEVLNVKDKKKIFEGEQGEQSNVRINETAPLMETNPNKSDSENEPGPEVLNVKDKKKIFEGVPRGEASLSPGPQGEASLSPVPHREASLSPAPQGEASLSPAPQGEAPLSPAPQGEAPLSPAPQGESPLSPAPQGEASLSPAPQGEASLSPAPQAGNSTQIITETDISTEEDREETGQ